MSKLRLPPGIVSGRLCMDGGVLDPLALRAVAPLADVVIEQDIGVEAVLAEEFG
jgi:hypothetical protein